jgi:hypothetical protein
MLHVAQQRTDQRPVDQHHRWRIRRHYVLLELHQTTRRVWLTARWLWRGSLARAR